jgi:hypothetical protein
MKMLTLIAAGGLVWGWAATAPAQPGGVSPGPAGPTPSPADEEAEQAEPSKPIPPPAALEVTPGTTGVMTDPEPAPAQPLPAADNNNRRGRFDRFSRLGAAVMAGGGYEDFTNDGLQGMTSGGGTWDARAIAGMYQFVGLEAAYVGAARSIDTLGISSNAGLVSNGIEGALRVNIPVFIRGRQLIEPFGFVGLGWQHYNLTNTNTNTSSVAGSDDVMTMPYGGGLAYAYGRFLADARFTYRQTYQNDLLRTTGGRLNNWGIGTHVGLTF